MVLKDFVSNLNKTLCNSSFSIDDYSATGKDELEALAETETEDPIVKAEREFFEIIKQVSIL